MSKSLIAKFCLIISLGLVSGCGFVFRMAGSVSGSGNVISESRDVEDFDRISFAGSGTLTIVVGQPTAIELKCDDNLLPLIRTEVKDGTLHIYPDQPIMPTDDLRIDISTEQLKRFALAGSCKATIDALDSKRLELAISGSGNITCQGTAEELAIEIAGSGDVNCFELASRTVQVSIAGSGEVSVHALDRLKVRIAGSGRVRYEGNPTVEQQIAGSGSIVPVSQAVENPD
ncbi:MAG TPA: head GIN domain-containing protein [Pirellulaceae bacterium]|nr:head GIN domain-containing protein [Pirellulaceae bacterium]